MKVTAGYSRLQIGLHWLMAILIIAAFVSHDGAVAAMDAREKGGDVGFVPHVAFGMAVLLLVIVRVFVRLSRGAPAAPGVPGSLAVTAAIWGHRLIYLMMIAVPLGGIATFFLGFDVGDMHGLAGQALMVIVLGHALVALFHQYVLKDGLLRRMMKAE